MQSGDEAFGFLTFRSSATRAGLRCRVTQGIEFAIELTLSRLGTRRGTTGPEDAIREPCEPAAFCSLFLFQSLLFYAFLFDLCGGSTQTLHLKEGDIALDASTDFVGNFDVE